LQWCGRNKTDASKTISNYAEICFRCRYRILVGGLLRPRSHAHSDPTYLRGALKISRRLLGIFQKVPKGYFSVIAKPQKPLFIPENNFTHRFMTRIITALLASTFALLLTACGCCTSDVKPPGLRPLPQFKEIQSAPQVDYRSSK